MRPLAIIGVILLAIGILSLGYQGFTYVTKEKVVDAGPIQVSADREKTVWIPPVIGAICLVSGVALLMAGMNSRSRV